MYIYNNFLLADSHHDQIISCLCVYVVNPNSYLPVTCLKPCHPLWLDNKENEHFAI